VICDPAGMTPIISREGLTQETKEMGDMKYSQAFQNLQQNCLVNLGIDAGLSMTFTRYPAF
jgi:hypothetical protein